ncbi:hypothetical protein [Nocardioides acrostichi]|uniref:Uncharacterized protein n=1 Tax=Nocardioides acrostichi TaxID=2784339 RepID=A0A930UV14_9ACTN|nr:hypothetical protein [Nocardioides acrostichi]MBF4161368.1 hypothetical protein [Nocardioides acrostichi]
MTTRPRVTLMLPGEWTRLAWADERQSRTLRVALVEGGAGDDAAAATVASIDAELATVQRAGGDQALLRVGSQEPTLLLTSWPDQWPCRTVADLRALAPDDASVTVLEHQRGYPSVRLERTDAPEGTVLRTYWVANPDSGRLHVVDVTFFGTAFPAEHLELYDLLATTLHWTESEDVAS